MCPAAAASPRRRTRAFVALLAGACLTAFVPGNAACAQDWAKQMFPVTSHNFGTVAKGSKTEYRFRFSNLYKEDVRVVSVRTSCCCTSPVITALIDGALP